jgi:hypothetical protein
MKQLWQVRVTRAVYRALRFRALEEEKPASALATEILGKALGVPKASQKQAPARTAHS